MQNWRPLISREFLMLSETLQHLESRLLSHLNDATCDFVIIRNEADKARVKNLFALRCTRLSWLFYNSLIHIQMGKVEKKEITLWKQHYHGHWSWRSNLEGVFVVFRIKRHFTAQGGVFRLFVRSLTPPKIEFYLLGDVARSIGRDTDCEKIPFILRMKDFCVFQCIL